METSPYLCPNCSSNRSRFNIIEQVARSVRLHVETGELIEQLDEKEKNPFHITYSGPQFKVQCATCGIIEDEHMFIKRAKRKND